MHTSSAASFERVVSSPRLDSYRRFFKAITIDEAIGLYLWNGEVSACFASHIAYFEIALRNSVHRAMSCFYSRGQHASCHWYDLIWQKLKASTRQRIIEVRQRRTGSPPGPDEMVASLSFGFWPVVLGNIQGGHAPSIFPAIFPYHPFNDTPTLWRDARTRTNAMSFAFELLAFRNRLAHHEPLWKFGAIKDTSANPPLTLWPATTCQADSLERLRRIQMLFESAIALMDASLHGDLQSASWRQRLDFLLTERGVERFRRRRNKPHPQVLTPHEFRRRFPLLGRANQPIKVRCAGTSGVFVPD